MNILFGLGSTLPWFCVLWGLNGILQGWGGPACAKIITSWFATKERGTYWGLWNISHNLGAFLAPLLAGTAARALGWRWGVFAPGLIGLSIAGLVYAIVRNSPEDIGRQPAEVAQALALKGFPALKASRKLKTSFHETFLVEFGVALSEDVAPPGSSGRGARDPARGPARAARWYAPAVPQGARRPRTRRGTRRAQRAACPLAAGA